MVGESLVKYSETDAELGGQLSDFTPMSFIYLAIFSFAPLIENKLKTQLN